MHPSLANALDLIAAGRAGEARELLQRQLRTRPRDGDLHYALGRVLLAAGDLARAAFHLEQAAALAPQNADFLVGHGVALGRQGKPARAEKAYRRAAELEPRNADAQLGLSHALVGLNRFDEAASAARKACDLEPGNRGATINLAICLTRIGRGRESVERLREAIARQADDPQLLTQRAAELNYLSGVDPAETFRAHEELGRVIERSQGGVRGMAPRDADPERRLRVAYLSPDFRSHSVASFVEPILRAHDRGRFHVTCISTTTMRDEVTARLASLPDEWVDATGESDDALAARIAAVAPDVLVDLAGHTSESRVRVMARRLAPVQVSMIGYPHTTGIPAIDARIVDSMTDPPGSGALATERLIRLDPCFLCYQPPRDLPDLRATSPDAGAPVVFASFNIISKVSDACLDAWGEVLRSVSGSVLRLKSACFDEPGPREDWAERFEVRGVARERLDLRGHAPSFREHLAAYEGVTVALDTFPYNGTTTTCESLWMGVPVVTFRGAAHAGRVSASLLRAAGLGGWVAPDVAGYVALARGRASDAVPGPELRERVRRSALCDGAAYSARLESAFGELWRERCAGAG